MADGLEPTQAAPEAAPAEADTPAAPAPDTGENTQQSPQTTDWEARYKASQAEMTRKAMALAEAERRLAERVAVEDGSDEGDEDAPAPQRSQRAAQREAELQAVKEQLDEAQWTIARAVYPEPVIEAYAAAATLLEQAQTAADYVGAFEAYHQARSRGATPQQAAGSPPPPATPHADSDRSDAPALPDVEAQLREAKEKHNLEAGMKALLARAGIR